MGALTAAGVLFVLAYPFPTDAGVEARADIALTPVEQREDRWVDARVELDPSVVEGAEWFNVTSWQGGGSIVQDLEETSEGVYETRSPVPVYGEWKSLIRLQRGKSLVALPIFLPEDSAIPAEAVEAPPEFSRSFTSDKEIVLREAKDVDAPLIYGASAAMAAIATGWALALGWGLARVGRLTPPAPRPKRKVAPVARPKAAR